MQEHTRNSAFLGGRRRRGFPLVRAATAGGAPFTATAAATAAAEFRQVTLRSGVTTDPLELLERCRGPSRALLQACRVLPPHLNQGHTTHALRPTGPSGISRRPTPSAGAPPPFTGHQQILRHRRTYTSFSLPSSSSSSSSTYSQSTPPSYTASATALLRTSNPMRQQDHGRAASCSACLNRNSDSSSIIHSTSSNNSRPRRVTAQGRICGPKNNSSPIQFARGEAGFVGVSCSEREVTLASTAAARKATIINAVRYGKRSCQSSPNSLYDKELLSTGVLLGSVVVPTQRSYRDSPPLPLRTYFDPAPQFLSVAPMEAFDRQKNKGRIHSAAAAVPCSAESNYFLKSAFSPSCSSSSPPASIHAGSSTTCAHSSAGRAAVPLTHSPRMLHGTAKSHTKKVTKGTEEWQEKRLCPSVSSPRGKRELLDIDVWWEPIRKKINVLSDLCKDMLRDIERAVARQRLPTSSTAELRLNPSKNPGGTAALVQRQQGGSRDAVLPGGVAALLVPDGSARKWRTGGHAAAACSSAAFPLSSLGERRSVYLERSVSKILFSSSDSDRGGAGEDAGAAASAAEGGRQEREQSASCSPGSLGQGRTDSVLQRSRCYPGAASLRRRCSSVFSRKESCSANSITGAAAAPYPPPAEAAAAAAAAGSVATTPYGRQKSATSWIEDSTNNAGTAFAVSASVASTAPASAVAGFGFSAGAPSTTCHTSEQKNEEGVGMKVLLIPEEDTQARLPVFTKHLGDLAEILQLTGPDKKTRKKFVAAGCPFLIPLKEIHSFFAFSVIKHSLNLPPSYTWNQKVHKLSPAVHAASAELNEAVVRLCKTISRHWVVDLYNVVPPHRRGAWQQLLQTLESQLEVFTQSYRKFEHEYCTEMLNLLDAVFKPLELMCKEAVLLLEKFRSGTAVEGLSLCLPGGVSSTMSSSFSPRGGGSAPARTKINCAGASFFTHKRAATAAAGESSSSCFSTFITQASSTATCSAAATVSTTASAHSSSASDYASMDSSTSDAYEDMGNSGNNNSNVSSLKCGNGRLITSGDFLGQRRKENVVHESSNMVQESVGKRQRNEARLLLQREAAVDFQQICESSFLQQLEQLYKQGSFSTTDVPVENFDPALLQTARKIVNIWETSDTSKLSVANAVASCLLFVTHRCMRRLAHMKEEVENFALHPTFAANIKLRQNINEYEEVWRVSECLLDQEFLIFAEELMEMLTRDYGASRGQDKTLTYPALNRSDIPFDFHMQDEETSAAMQRMQVLLSLPDPPEVVLYDLLPILMLFELLLRSDTAVYEKLFVPETEEAQELFRKVKAGAKELKLSSWKKLRLYVLQQLLAKATATSRSPAAVLRSAGGRGAAAEGTVTGKSIKFLLSPGHASPRSPAASSSSPAGSSSPSSSASSLPAAAASSSAASPASSSSTSSAAATVAASTLRKHRSKGSCHTLACRRGSSTKAVKILPSSSNSSSNTGGVSDFGVRKRDEGTAGAAAGEGTNGKRPERREERVEGDGNEDEEDAETDEEEEEDEREEVEREGDDQRHKAADATQVQRYEMLTSYFLQVVDCLLPLHSPRPCSSSTPSPHTRSRGGAARSNNVFDTQQEEEKSVRDARCSRRWECVFDFVKAELLCRLCIQQQQQQQACHAAADIAAAATAAASATSTSLAPYASPTTPFFAAAAACPPPPFLPLPGPVSPSSFSSSSVALPQQQVTAGLPLQHLRQHPPLPFAASATAAAAPAAASFSAAAAFLPGNPSAPAPADATEALSRTGRSSPSCRGGQLLRNSAAAAPASTSFSFYSSRLPNSSSSRASPNVLSEFQRQLLKQMKQTEECSSFSSSAASPSSPSSSSPSATGAAKARQGAAWFQARMHRRGSTLAAVLSRYPSVVEPVFSSFQ